MAFFIIGSVHVRVENGLVTVSRVPTSVMVTDIAKIFKTARFANHLFSDISRASFSFEEFFALEFYHIVEGIVSARKRGTNVRVLYQILQQLKENTWLKDIDREVSDSLDFSYLSDITYTLLPYQMEFLKRYSKTVKQYHLRGMLLAAAAGSGKTATCFASAQCAQAERIIVVCPKPAVERVWVSNVHEVFKKPQSYWYQASGRPYENQRIAIFHYESLEKAMGMIRELKRPRTFVILDESHNLTEMQSLRTARFIDLCNQLDAKDVILASGTPIKATSIEAIPLFRAIDPLFTDEVMRRFKLIFKGDVTRATEILSKRLNAVTHKVEKSELKLEKPLFTDIKIKIPTGDQYTLTAIAADMAKYAEERLDYFKHHRQEYVETYRACVDMAASILLRKNQPASSYKAAHALHQKYLSTIELIIQANGSAALRQYGQEMIFCNKYEKEQILPNLLDKSMRDRFKEAKTVYKYVKLKVQGECLGRVLGRKRIEAHQAMVPYIDYESIVNSTLKKTVIFTSFVEVVNDAAAFLRTQNYNPVTVSGETTKFLPQIVQKFELDETVNPLIATYASLSTAVPLIMADTMIMINMPFRDYIFDQTVARIWRLGATTQTRIFTIILDTGEAPNISSRNLDILKWSREQVEKILNIESPFNTGEEEVPSLESYQESYPDYAVEELQIANESITPYEPEGLFDVAQSQAFWAHW